jgi:glycolate oxidase FAD binding subunit
VRGVLARMKEAGVRTAPRVAGHLGAGIARFHLAGPDDNALYAAFAALWSATASGDDVRTRVIERATPAIKSTHPVWGPPPASLPLMREVKKRLDPDGVLSPGRFVGGL